MKRTLIVSLCLVCITPLMLYAQVSDNVNVLPVYRSNPPSAADFLYGDLLAEGQNEATVVVDPNNPDHRMVFFNDYRFVYADQPPLGSIGMLGDWLFKGVKGLFARLMGWPERAAEEETGHAAQAPGGEPWIGCAVTYDGGITYDGCTVPGFPADTSRAGLASPAYLAGDQFATDPKVLGVDPFGTFIVTYITGTRGGSSGLMASKFQFLSGEEVRHAVEYLGTKQLDRGNNMANGLFFDLPNGSYLPPASGTTADVWRVTSARYSGQDKNGKTQTRMILYESRDGGNTWTTGTYIDKTYGESQGTGHVVLPNGSTLIFVRNYNSPNTYYLVTVARDGTLSRRPTDLLATDPMTTLATFDQPFVTLRDVPFSGRIEPELTARTFASPSFAGTPSGNLVVGVWQERVDPTSLLPSTASGAVPRIVWKYSLNGGGSFSQRRGLVNEANNRSEPYGYGFFNPGFQTGVQYQPQVACGAGDRCLVTWYENEPYAYGEPGFPIGGYDRVANLRGAFIQLDAQGQPVVGPSFQISRHNYSLQAVTADQPVIDSPDQIKQLCPPGSDPTTGAGCYPAKSYTGLPFRDSVTTSFMGDYTAVTPVERYVRDATGTPRLAVSGADVPGGARFFVAFTDNSNLLWPGVAPAHSAAEADWANYFSQKWQGPYLPGGMSAPGAACQNDQLKDQNVMASTVSFAGLVLQSPNRFKPWPPPATETSIEFPTTVYNLSTARKSYWLELAGTASFSNTDSAGNLTRQTGVVTVEPHTTSSFNVYAFDGNPVRVTATECQFSGGVCAKVSNTQVTGAITFNAAPPPPGSPEPTYQPVSIALQPGTKSPGTKSPGTKSPGTKSPGTKSPGTKSPGTKSAVPPGDTVYQVVDYSWQITPTSTDDAGTFAFLAGIDQAYKDNYVFDLSIERNSTLYASVNCQPLNDAIGTVVGRVVDDTNPLPGLSPADFWSGTSPVPPAPSATDIIKQNSTFTLGPTVLTTPDEGCDLTTGAGRLGECTIAQPRAATSNSYTVWLRAYLIKDPTTMTPDQFFDPIGDNPDGTGIANPPSGIAADIACTDPSCLVENGPNLAVPTPATAGVTPTTVSAGQSVTFPVDSVTIKNIGDESAGKHAFGIYLSTASTQAGLPRNSDGTIKVGSTTRLVASGDIYTSLDPGTTEAIAAQTLVVPIDLPRLNADGTGTYYAWAYIDYGRKVNETNENDNMVRGGPITVLPPKYVFIGLFSPCSGLTCEKKTGTALPLAFQLSYDGLTAVDSKGTDPRFKFYAPAAGGACQTNIGPATPQLFQADPDNVSSGSSLWQWFDASCAPVGPNTCARPAYTWQYNFQGKDPVTGADLPLGCYVIAVEDVSTNQTVGSQFGPITWLRITLK